MTTSAEIFTLPYIGIVTAKHLLIILHLILIEGLLSFDNALALAGLVKKRLKDPIDQQHALRWGIFGAYFFRILIIFIGVWLMKFAWIKFLAGAYLVWLAISELFFNKSKTEEEEKLEDNSTPKTMWISPIWSTIIQVELMDLMFSVDSIGVALALSDIKWVLISGACLGIIMMRFAAGQFITLMDKFPVLEKTAFVLVGLAGMNVILKTQDLPLGFTLLTLDMPIPENIFLALLFIIFCGSLVINKMFPKYFIK